AGPPSQICGPKCKLSIDQLISYSCKGFVNTTVQEMVQAHFHTQEEEFMQQAESGLSLKSSTQKLKELPTFNRTRFSLHSTTVLTRRYLTYIRQYLWRQWAAVIGLYIIYGYSLTMFFDR